MIRFSILIPIYNRLKITQQGLASLYKALDRYKRTGQGKCQFDIVVIDDGSTDGSSAWIRENYPAVHLLQGTGNLWWSGAINVGARHTVEQLNSDYLLLWNDDIFPAENFFTEVENIFLKYPSTGTILGSKILFKGQQNRVWSVGGYFDKVWGKYGLHVTPGPDDKEFFECDWQPGMGTFIPVSILRSTNFYWDEKRFPQYHGDSDFTLRCKETGIKIKTCLSFVIYNGSEAPPATRNYSLKNLRNSLTSMRSHYNFEKRVLFYKQHGVQPFYYWGLFKTYAIFFASFFKRKLFATALSIRPFSRLSTADRT